MLVEGTNPDKDNYFLHIASRGKELFPENVKELPIDQQWEKSKQLLEPLRGADWFGFAKAASRIKTI